MVLRLSATPEPALRDGVALRREDLAACRASLAKHARTFHAASLLLPAKVRGPATVLYGFCRLADDAVDVEGGRLEAIVALRHRLQRIYAGRPQEVPADRALAAIVLQFGIPQALLEFLIEGLAWDVEARRYDTLDELLAYAARVAGAVGAMMGLLMGVREPTVLARACDLGVAMQLSNIVRDVGEDARMGRLYLPRAWLREAGTEPEAWLADPHFDPAVAQAVQRLLGVAEALYARAQAGVARLPWACRPGIEAARRLYAEIGVLAGRRGARAFDTRSVVPDRRKLWLLAQACLPVAADARGLREPALSACLPLLQAVENLVPPEAGPGGPVEFVLRLFDRLEREERWAASVARARVPR